MRLFPKEPEIGFDEGFDPVKDIFQRAPVGENLRRLFTHLEDPIVLALDGPWGSGKSTFLKMWAGHMRQHGYPVIYYDAFKDDYTQDAFLALAGQVGLLIRELTDKEAPVVNYLNAAKKVGGAILRRGARVALKVGTAGIIDYAELEGIGKDAVDATGEEAEQAFSELLDSYLEDRDRRSQFAGTLSGLAVQINPTDPKPVIFIVDELDRCRPTFALDLLETMKHLFSVPGIHFVLGTNIQQLENSVSAAYGVNLDARTYLQKFIHVRFQLPIRTDQGVDDRRSYVERLSRLHVIQGEDAQVRRAVFSEITTIATARQLTFREIERICTYAVLSLAYLPKQWFNQPHVLAGILTLRVLSPQHFQMAITGQLRFEHVAQQLAISPETDARHFESRAQLWKFFCNEELPDDKVQEMSSWFWKYNVDRGGALRLLATTVADSFALITEPPAA